MNGSFVCLFFRSRFFLRSQPNDGVYFTIFSSPFSVGSFTSHLALCFTYSLPDSHSHSLRLRCVNDLHSTDNYHVASVWWHCTTRSYKCELFVVWHSCSSEARVDKSDKRISFSTRRLCGVCAWPWWFVWAKAVNLKLLQIYVSHQHHQHHHQLHRFSPFHIQSLLSNANLRRRWHRKYILYTPIVFPFFMVESLGDLIPSPKPNSGAAFCDVRFHLAPPQLPIPFRPSLISRRRCFAYFFFCRLLLVQIGLCLRCVVFITGAMNSETNNVLCSFICV